MTQATTYTVDFDTATVAFDDDLTDGADYRRAVDEIADRVEAELERRGLEGTVERRYGVTGYVSPSREDQDPTVWDAVLIEGVDELRAAVLGA